MAMTAMVLTIIAMAFLTYEGANTGSTNEIALGIGGLGGSPQTAAENAAATFNGTTPDMSKQQQELVKGRQVAAQSGCLACHKIGENGNAGPGPTLTQIGARIPRASILRSLKAGPGIMPSFKSLPPDKLNALADYLALPQLALG